MQGEVRTIGLTSAAARLRASRKRKSDPPLCCGGNVPKLSATHRGGTSANGVASASIGRRESSRRVADLRLARRPEGPLFVALAAFGMCVQAAWAPLAFIPGAFVGASAYFGNQGVFWATLVSLVAGALLAFASERFADVIEKAVPGRGAASAPTATTA